MICTASEVTIYTDISCSAGTAALSLLIPIVQERINLITNNYFLSDMYMGGSVTFNATAGTIVAGSSFADEGFVEGDEIYIYNSYRNDGYKTVGSVTTVTLTLSGSSVINEPSGRNVLISVVSWPNALKYIAAQMIKYDYDDRPSNVPGISSKSLGPYSVSYQGGVGITPFGYPQEMIDALSTYTVARLT